MAALVTIGSEYSSAKRLADALGIPIYAGYGPLPSPDELVIRWGNSEPYTADGKDFARVLNPAKAIRLNCNKLRALRKLSAVVDTPEIYTDAIPDKRYGLLRPFKHTGGRDFAVKRGPCPVPKGYYGTRWVFTKLEYRVWFAGAAVLCASRVRTRDKSKFPCRSEWGYRFGETPAGLGEAVGKARRTIGLDLGAADVLCRDGRFYFVELNSAPTVDADEIEGFFVGALQGL